MEKFIEELNNHTNNKFGFMLKSALLKKDADFCVVEILYKDGVMLLPAEKKEIEDFAVSILPKNFVYEFNFIKRYISEERIFDDTKAFLTKNFPSVSCKIDSVTLCDKKFQINITVDSLSCEHAKSKNMTGEIVKFLRSQYDNFDYNCDMQVGSVYVEDERQEMIKNFHEDSEDIYANRKIEFFDVVKLVGDFEEGLKADYIKDKTSPENAIVVCGKIASIQEKVIKRKPKAKNEEGEEKQESEEKVSVEIAKTEALSDRQVQIQASEKDTANSEQSAEKTDSQEKAQSDAESGESEGKEQEGEQSETKYQRKLYKFAIADFTGEMNCVFFSNKENQSKLEKLEVGSVIVVRGNLEADAYSGGNTLKVKDLAYCSIPDGLKEYIEYRKEKPFYEFVEPERIITYSQDNLMNFAEEKHVPKFLQGKTFVCYDFETTGLHYVSGDKIIEIGAVKIEDGKITEKFMSYVDPEKHIPEESSAISGIVDSDVQGAPTADKVLQDFYKWTRGAIIIGYNNINFDNIFLIGQGSQARWNFDNETDDVYKWAQKYVRGAKNYKLKTIADKLGVTLDNAHRAVYDALATAEVFIKIQEIYEKDIENALNQWFFCVSACKMNVNWLYYK